MRVSRSAYSLTALLAVQTEAYHQSGGQKHGGGLLPSLLVPPHAISTGCWAAACVGVLPLHTLLGCAWKPTEGPGHENCRLQPLLNNLLWLQ